MASARENHVQDLPRHVTDPKELWRHETAMEESANKGAVIVVALLLAAAATVFLFQSALGQWSFLVGGALIGGVFGFGLGRRHGKMQAVARYERLIQYWSREKERAGT